MRAEGQGQPRVNFRNGQTWQPDLHGEALAVAAVARGKALPQALASADFNEDGMTDVAVSYRSADGSGSVVLLKGNVDAVYPNAPEAQARRAAGVPAEGPWLSSAQIWQTAAADFVGAGDFDADGHWDLVAATRGGAALWWLPGDGKGGFGASHMITTPGRVTALVTGEINLRDGLTDIVVGLEGENGPAVAVYEWPQGALRGAPEVFSMPGPVAALALGRLDEEATIDLAVAAGNSLVLLRGRDRRLSFDESFRAEARPARLEARVFPTWLKGLAVGDYQGNDANEIALLGFDGTLRVLHSHPRRNVGLGTREKLAQWSELAVEGRFGVGGPAQLVTARVSAQSEDSLVVADTAGEQLRIIAANEDKRTPRLASVAEWAGDGPVAVLPLRLNSDAVSDLVVLQSNFMMPAVVASRPSATFTVTNTNDSGAGSLRQALLDANSSPAADAIAFAIPGAGVKTITPLSDLPILTGPTTIDATTQPGYAGTPLIELTNRGFNLDGAGCLVRGLVLNRMVLGAVPIAIRAGGNSVIEGNFIGTDATGNANFCPDTVCTGQGLGIIVGHFSTPAGTSGNLIGGNVSAARNVISGNSQEMSLSRGSDNSVKGNYLGINAAGTGRPPAPVGTSFSFSNGMGIGLTTNTTIGGPEAGARNVIVASGYNISINDQTNDNTIASGGTLVQGNYLGTNAAGTQRIEIPTNLSFIPPGIYCEGGGLFSPRSTTGPVIGGTTPTARNVGGVGVGWRGPYTIAPLRVQGNYIGTDVTGNIGLPHVTGFQIDESQGAVIGGSVPEAGNVIANIAGNAIYFDEVNTSLFTFLGPNMVQGNSIGVNAAGQCLGNAMDGVFMQVRSPQQIIKDNIIACNSRYGVRLPIDSEPGGIVGLPPRRVRVENNRIYSNTLMGIDLGAAGVTPNDAGDPDTGANDLQNFPIINSITAQPEANAPAAATIGGALNSQANGTYTINWYFSPATMPCANNQSREPVLSSGSATATTDANGNVSFSFPFDFPQGLTVGNMNATATDSNGNTSEFSPCFLVAAPVGEQGISLQFSAQTYTTSEESSVAILVTRSGDASQPVSVDYATGEGTASQRTDYTALSGTLNFAAGETGKPFTIPINDDLYPEGAETIPLTLANPTNGAVIGRQALATVTITDNDPSGSLGRLYVARLDGRQVVPATTSPGRGIATAVVDSNNQATFTLNYSGTVGIQQSLHLHGPAPFGANAPVLNIGFFTTINMTPTLLEQIRNGLLYVDVHTSVSGSANPEIRGQIVANPVEDLRYFVQQQYADFLGREPDLAGLDYWSEELLNCTRTADCVLGARRYQVSHAFFYELEFQQTGAYVYRLYRAAYGNNQPLPNPQTSQLPRYSSFISDRARVVGGASLAQAQQALADAFVARPEFLARYPANLTGPQFVDALLANILASSGADLSAQRAALLTLYSGAANPRGAVMYRLADDNINNPINNRAFINAEYARAFVATQYFGYLRRDPDQGGYNFWLNIINRFPLNDTRGQYAMVCAFITSQEYQERFGPISPRTNQECPPAP